MNLNSNFCYTLTFLFTTIFLLPLNGQTHHFTITLNGAQANAGMGTGSGGTGTGFGVYDEGTMQFTLNGDFSGLSGTTANAHVHGAPAGSNGGVEFGITYTTAATSGSFSGSAILSAAQEADLLGGGFYVNIHTSTFGGGEIRGQILVSDVHEFMITIDGEQANAGAGTGSSGTGAGTGIYYLNTMQLIVEGDFMNLTGTTTNAHVHQAPTGTNGGVVFGVNYTAGATNGTFDGIGTLSTAQETALLSDGMYINIHTSAFGAGEIRGQVIQNSTCAAMLDIDNGPIPAGTYSATIVNSSGGSIVPGSPVLFQASGEINLSDGFTVEEGAEFEAKIGDCIVE